jgi:hypothetical protein
VEHATLIDVPLLVVSIKLFNIRSLAQVFLIPDM